jgi:hypothetical protein
MEGGETTKDIKAPAAAGGAWLREAGLANNCQGARREAGALTAAASKSVTNSRVKNMKSPCAPQARPG